MKRRDTIILCIGLVEAIAAGAFLWHQRQQPNAPGPIAVLDTNAVTHPQAAYLGNRDAPYTLVEFGDYQCPPCAMAVSQVTGLLKNHPGRLRYTFRHYPLRIHPSAREAAIIAEAAREQGRFWQFHDTIFAYHADISHARILETARKVGLNAQQLTYHRSSTKAVDRDIQDADRLHIEGTPTFILCCPDGRVWRLGTLSQAAHLIL